MRPAVSIVVPSLGLSPDIEELLVRLREELGPVGGELVWVHQGSEGPAPPDLGSSAGRLVRDESGRPSFSGAVERGLREAGAPIVGLLNDDAVPRPGWLATLLGTLEATPGAVAVQGIQTLADRPDVCDGCGLEWNRRWEAVQIGHGDPLPDRSAPFEVYGVSATAALYRRSALDAVAFPSGRILETRLGSWYEDVELADRLRARGGRSLCVPGAVARHRGSATGALRTFRRHRLLARNRWLVTARLLGRRWPAAWPDLLAVDLREAGRRLAGGELRAAAGRLLGPASAAPQLARFLHPGPPRVAPGEIARLRIGSPT